MSYMIIIALHFKLRAFRGGKESEYSNHISLGCTLLPEYYKCSNAENRVGGVAKNDRKYLFSGGWM